MNDSTEYIGPITSDGLPRGEHWHTNVSIAFAKAELTKDQSDWCDHVNTCRVCGEDIAMQTRFIIENIGGRRRV